MRLLWILYIGAIKCLPSWTEEMPTFRVIAPQIICKSDTNDSSSPATNDITISFQPHDGIRLSYKFRIFFKNLGPDFTQRETLLVWKIVRTLEYRINVNKRLEISNDNLLFLNKSEIFSGITYIFHVIGITDAGETTKEQTFSLQYPNSIEHNSERPNLLLIGSNFAVSSETYILHAKTSFCTNTINFYLRWIIYNLSEEHQHIRHTIGSTLKIPPNSFVAGSNTTIEAQILEANTSKLLAKDTIDIHFPQRGFQAYILPSFAKIGINCSLLLQLLIRDFDNSIDDIQISWQYYEINSPMKVYVDNAQNGTKMRISFNKAGSYHVMAKVKTNNNIITNVIAAIEVVPDISIRYDFQNVLNMSPAANQSFHFKILVLGLMQNCTAGWICVQEDGFKFINKEENSEAHFGHVEITDIEKKNSLKYGNIEEQKVNKEIFLRIPQSDFTNSTWKGLQGDAKYKFRLDVVCPPYSKFSSTPTAPAVTSHFEFIIHTNSPPICSGVQVTPYNGTALKTMFHISASEAKDLLLDSPLSYELCGRFENSKLCFGKFLEYKSWETILPYTIAPILYVLICDIRNACNTVYTNNITVNFIDQSADDYEKMTLQIAASFLRTDYADGNNLIMMASLTYKHGNSNLYEKFRQFIRNLVNREINKLIEYPDDQYFVSKTDVIQCVAQIKMNLELLQLNDINTLERLLEVIEQMTSSDSNEMDNRGFFGMQNNYQEFEDRYSRKSHRQSDTAVTSDYVDIYLSLIEDMYRAQLVENVQSFNLVGRIVLLMRRMCYSDNILTKYFESTIASIWVEKYTGSYILNNEFTISNSSNEQIIKLKIINEPLISENKDYCIAVAQFPVDHFTKETALLSNIMLYDMTDFSSIMEKTSNEERRELRHAIEIQLPKRSTFENMCVFRVKNQWSLEDCEVAALNESYVTCTCSHLGFFKLSKSEGNDLSYWSTNGTANSTKNILPAVNGNTQIQGNEFTKIKTEGLTNHMDYENTNITKAGSILNYITVAILFLVVLAIVLLIVYRRHRNMNAKKSSVPYTLNTKFPRRRKSGIQYAAIHDSHLLHGTF